MQNKSIHWSRFLKCNVIMRIRRMELMRQWSHPAVTKNVNVKVLNGILSRKCISLCKTMVDPKCDGKSGSVIFIFYEIASGSIHWYLIMPMNGTTCNYIKKKFVSVLKLF